MYCIKTSLEAASLNHTEERAIAQHLGCGVSEIIEIQEWLYVLWVKFERKGKKICRFVSYKVIRQQLPIRNGMYWVSNKVLRIQFADSNSFRMVHPLTKQVVGWIELTPFKGYDHNGDEISSLELRALHFRPLTDELDKILLLTYKNRPNRLSA